jgi:HKD family nuclease
VKLHIQDPGDPNASVLHEQLLQLFGNATKGAGAFAFVTSEGAKLLFADPAFLKFAAKGTFDLIVGIDEITNVGALTTLKETSESFPGLTVRAFYHTLNKSIFHPKVCWFRHKNGVSVVTGSGNLTPRGLRGNWEAFAISQLQGDSATELEAQWDRWLVLHSAQLKPLTDPDVLARAALNIWRRKIAVAKIGKEEVEAPVTAKAGVEPVRDVLIAEIPRASTRWNQANFDLNSFKVFFGAKPGAIHRIVLQHVDSEGTLGSLEARQSVSVKSQNYRFELEAAAGLSYPSAGRPITVFVKIAPRTFRYRLLMPNDTGYGVINALLGTMWAGRSDRMRRIITNTEILRQAWPDSPLWSTPLELQD